MSIEVPDREPYTLEEPSLVDLSRVLDVVVDSMRDVTRSAEGSYQYVPEDKQRDFAYIAEKLNGERVEGETEGTSYFVETNKEGIFALGKLAAHRNQRDPFKGIWRGLREVKIARPPGSGNGFEIYECFAIDPLYNTYDQVITGYFARRGRLDDITHVYGQRGSRELAQHRVYIPVFNYLRGTLKPFELGNLRRLSE